MPELLDLQRSFAGAIFDAGCAPPNEVVSHVTPRPNRRFNVYRNNVTSSLIDVLQAYFPVVARLVGDEFFRAMARVFVTQAPPTSPILSRYGAAFPDFLESFPPVQDLPYLADIAQLEWLRQRAYHAADAPALRGEDLAALPAEHIHCTVFRLHPSLGLIASSYPIISIWRTNTQDDVVNPIDVEAGAEFALVVRPQLAVHVVPLSAGSHAFASALIGEKSLQIAQSEALSVDPEFDLRSVLANFIERGVLTGSEISSKPKVEGGSP